MSDADELERRARQHDQISDEKADHWQSRHEGIAEGYRRAAQLLADEDADDDPEHPTQPHVPGRTIVVRPLNADARRYRLEQAPTIPTADAYWIEERWSDADGWAEVGRDVLAEATIDGRPAFATTVFTGP